MSDCRVLYRKKISQHADTDCFCTFVISSWYPPDTLMAKMCYLGETVTVTLGEDW